MKNKVNLIRKGHAILFVLTCLCYCTTKNKALAQQGIVVNLAMLDGMEITPNNVLNYQVINSGKSVQANVKGVLNYRNSGLRFTYEFATLLNPGTNSFSKDKVSPTWMFSENALRELFFNYSKLPEGTYEYCVEVTLKASGGEAVLGDPVDACLYNTSSDIFLINLLNPENNAKISEMYPMFSWIVNYPFASELTYRLRVAEIKDGQSNSNAIARNNPVYQDNQVLSTTQTYPVTARPLEKWQPYAWTVDAYYKGILLGGAEVWKFTIVDDSVLNSIPRNQSYYEFAKHNADTKVYAVGDLKLKYVNDDPTDSLTISFYNAENNELKFSRKLQLALGDNRLLTDLVGRGFGHLKNYLVIIKRKNGNEYKLPFLYVNPDFLK